MTASSGHLDNEPTLAVSLHLSDGGDKDQTPYIVIKDLSNVTSAKCSTVGLDVNDGMEQVVVVFPTMKCIPKVVLISVEPMDIFLPRSIASPKQDRPRPTMCSMKSTLHENKALMTMYDLHINPWSPPSLETYRSQAAIYVLLFGTLLNEKLRLEGIELKPWPPPTSRDGVIRGWDSLPMAGPKFKLYWARVHFMLPWPPLTRVTLAWEPFDMGVQVIGTVILTMAELKPWPPPVQSWFNLLFTMDILHIGWNLVNTASMTVWGEMIKTMKLVSSTKSKIASRRAIY